MVRYSYCMDMSDTLVIGPLHERRDHGDSDRSGRADTIALGLRHQAAPSQPRLHVDPNQNPSLITIDQLPLSPRALFFFFSSRRRHTRFDCDWSSDVCSSDLPTLKVKRKAATQKYKSQIDSMYDGEPLD